MNKYVIAISIALYLMTFIGVYNWIPFLFVCLINQLKEEIDVIENRYKKLDIKNKKLDIENKELKKDIEVLKDNYKKVDKKFADELRSKIDGVNG